ncbi:FAD-dependent oxidoreductase [Saccharomonospora sp. NPDC046836]|uniref:FAD-dependent oxidoreductase n=1 Tax=Saccharomonospora sp. NPDC046836 TaxID=3156921 RepID=UPI0033EEFC0E
MNAAAKVAEFDFVVIGSGAAGLTGAVVAALNGLSVLVVEKTALLGGTTAVSGGTVWIPNNDHESEVGVEDSLDDALSYLRACVGEAGDPAHVTALAGRGAEAIRFLEKRAGLRFVPMPSAGGSMDYRPWLAGAKVGGRGLTSPETDLGVLGEWAKRIRLVDTSEWTFDPRDYITERMHLDPPGLERPGASMFSPPPDDLDARPRPASVGRGAALVAQLVRAGLAAGVEYLLGVRAEELTTCDGRATGVRLRRSGGEELNVRASAGILLATGGYSNDERLRRSWLAREIQFSCELESNSGDGHRMGMAVGAQTAGLGDAWWMPHIPLGSGNAVVNTAGSREDRSLPHTLMVNDAGVRFMNESVNYHDAGEYFASKVGGWHSNFPAWLIFDSQGVEKYAMLSWKVPPAGEELPDWLRLADTISELAGATGLDPAALSATVTRFNGFALAGVDEDFQRGESRWDRAWGDPRNSPNPCLAPLEKGPFYAVRMYAGALSTRGGLRVDADARVCSAANEHAIQGLYAAGNCSNGGPAASYPGPGATLGAAVTFGYLAAMHASGAALPPVA